jgi:dolichol kinase
LLADWVFRGFIDNTRAKLIVSWLVLTVASIAFVIWKNLTAEATNTIDRKYFHFIMVLVCVPGIFLDFRLLYICSIAAVCAFIILEVIRLLRIEICHVPVGDIIENCVKIFRDHKDEGVTILTPVYLLAGCSLPFWLNLADPHADVTNLTGPDVAAAFAGILSIGIGDTFASIGGLALGRTKWKDSNKSLEGTLCSLAAQLLVILALWASNLSSIGTITMSSLVVAAVINAFVEAKTDQIDNLVLPLLTYNVIIVVQKALVFYYVRQRNLLSPT